MACRPDIVCSSLDAERLKRLLASLPHAAFPGKEELEEVLAHSTIVAPQDFPPDVVTMNSTVRFRVDTEEFRLLLVYPLDSRKRPNSISILSTVGSALLGLTPGDEIEWPRPTGTGTMRVHLLEVTSQPERAGIRRG